MVGGKHKPLVVWIDNGAKFVNNKSIMKFPKTRARRLRQNAVLRDIVRETRLSVNDFVYPLFTVEGRKIKKEISSLPGQFHFSVDELVKEGAAAAKLGIKAVLLFGIPAKKDEKGSGAYAKNGIVQRAVRALKKEIPGVLVITDVCLCEYTSHGHCGIVKEKSGNVENDSTLVLLAKTALSHAESGADIVAPSDMMDGRVAAIRRILDENKFTHIPILSYAAKYASAFYGPFREAAASAPQFGDRKSYQMDTANAREALKEVALDVKEGADIVMVKPALSYLDIIVKIKEKFLLPVAAYNVSGEYAMVKAAVKQKLVDEKKITLEILTSIKRAGADLILTYHAKEAAAWLRNSD